MSEKKLFERERKPTGIKELTFEERYKILFKVYGQFNNFNNKHFT